MNRSSPLAHLAAFLALISAFDARLDAAEPPHRAPVVARGGNRAEGPKDDFYVGSTTGNRRITIDVRRGVLANDQPPEPLNKALSDRELVAELVEPPKNAAHFALNADGSFVYEPQPGFVGLDTFRYVIKGVDVVPASAMIQVPQIPVAIRVKTDADGIPIQPKELTKRKSSNGAGFVVYPVNGPVNFAIPVPYVVDSLSPRDGYASLDADFSLGFTAEWTPKEITIPANSEEVAINLTVLPDKLVEGREMVSIFLQHNGPSKFTLQGQDWVASLKIEDNDYWKWDKQSISGSYKPKEFNPKMRDWIAPLGGAWFVDGKTGKRVWDDGDSKFQPTASYRVWDDRIVVKASARWEWYEFHWSMVERKVENPNADMDVAFDFEHLSGNISVRSGSGSGMRLGHVRINHRYTIDNSGTSTKVVTVWYEVVAAVGGVMASGRAPFGINKGGSTTRSAENSDGGGTALSESRIVTFTLRATEDP